MKQPPVPEETLEDTLINPDQELARKVLENGFYLLFEADRDALHEESENLPWRKSVQYEAIQWSRGVVTPEMIEKARSLGLVEDFAIEATQEILSKAFGWNLWIGGGVINYIAQDGVMPTSMYEHSAPELLDAYAPKFKARALEILHQLDSLREGRDLLFEESFLGYGVVRKPLGYENPTIPPPVSTKELFDSLKLVLPIFSAENLDLFVNTVSTVKLGRPLSRDRSENVILAQLAFEEALTEWKKEKGLE